MGSESPNSIELLPGTRTLNTAGRVLRVVKGWNDGAWIALSSLLAAGVLYSGTFASLSVAWRDTENHTYTHGYLIVAVSVALLFARTRALHAAPVTRGAGAPLLLVPVVCAWLIGLHAPIQILHQVAFPIILWLAVYGLAGWRVARLCAFPIAYLYFAIPVWDYATGSLQTMSILAVQALLRASSIPAYFEGEVVEIAAGIFHIEQGCSGLHFMIVALALATLHGEVNRCSAAERLKLVALGVVCALISNWLRIYVIIVAGHLTQMQHYLITVDHYYFGWLVFVLGMVVFFFVGARWIPRRKSQSAPPAAPALQVAYPQRVLFTLLLCVAPGWHLLARSFERPVIQPLVPAQAAEWAGPWTMASDLTLFRSADEQYHARYVHAGREVDVRAAAYANQATGKKISGYGTAVFQASETVVDAGGVVTAAGRRYAETQVRSRSGALTLIWTRYDVGARSFTHAVNAQLWYGLQSLVSMPAVHVVSLRTACDTDCVAARAALERFAAASLMP